MTASLEYDAAKRPTEVDFSGDPLSRTYDRDGNITAEGRSLTGVSGDAGSGTATFNYDGLGRVTGMDGLARDDTFTYDRSGNRVSKTEGATTTTYLYDRTDQLIKQTIAGNDTVFAYNAYGDMTSSADAFDTVTAHAYDAGGRLVSLTPPGASASAFAYDALGRVTTRTTGSATLTYRYVGTGHLSFATVPGSGAATYSLIDASAGRVALDTGGTSAWTMFDLHGNLAGAQAETSDTVVSALRYDAYGQLIDDYVAGSGATAMPWRFQGRLDVSPDADQALYDFGARMYRPSAAAFTQLDTYAGQAQNPLSMNRFLYAHASPVTLIDPDGHCPTCDRKWIDGVCPPRTCQPEHLPAYVNSPGSSTSPGSTSYSAPTSLLFEDVLSLGELRTPDPVKRLFDSDYYRMLGAGGCNVIALACRPQDFQRMDGAARAAWMRALEIRMNVEDWFNGVEVIIEFATDKGLLSDGSWFSVVDSYILAAIQDGAARAKGIPGAGTASVAGSEIWAEFFVEAAREGYDEDVLMYHWGRAEQAATNFGIDSAMNQGLRAGLDEVIVLVGFGSLWRSGVANAEARRDAMELIENNPLWIENSGLAYLSMATADDLYDPRQTESTRFFVEGLWFGAERLASVVGH